MENGNRSEGYRAAARLAGSDEEQLQKAAQAARVPRRACMPGEEHGPLSPYGRLAADLLHESMACDPAGPARADLLAAQASAAALIDVSERIATLRDKQGTLNVLLEDALNEVRRQNRPLPVDADPLVARKLAAHGVDRSVARIVEARAGLLATLRKSLDAVDVELGVQPFDRDGLATQLMRQNTAMDAITHAARDYFRVAEEAL